MQNIDDQTAVHTYASGLPDFGGMFHRDDQLVVLFTGQLERHTETLRRRVSEPGKLEVARAARSWAQVSQANRHIQDVLLGGVAPDPTVTSVGIGLQDGQFVVEVGVAPYTPEVVAEIADHCTPERVVVRPRERARLLAGANR